MLALNWSDPWVIGALAAVGGVLALVGVTFSYLPQRRVRAAALAAGFLGIAGLAAAAGISIHALAALRNPAAPRAPDAPPGEPRPPALTAQEALERFRRADSAGRLALVSRLPAGEQDWHTVGHGDVTQTLVERGAVEPVLATDVVCQVRGREGGKPASTIKSVVEDGTLVKKGQLLMELDDAPLREELRRQKAVVEQKQAALASAEKERAGAAVARAALDATTKRVKELEEDVAHCKIVAPHDGLLIYYVPEQARFGSGAGLAIVAQGEPVRQGQKLMRVCDLSKLQVQARIHEALISRVRAGQAARVRVDAFPGRQLNGRVTQVAAVASQQDWLTADVKVYPTTVALDGDVAGLKPGMSAEVTLVIEQRQGVLRLPVQALLGAGGKSVCYVREGEDIAERLVAVGASDGAFVEVTGGLKEGEAVLGDPRALAARLAERLGTGPPGPGARGPAPQGAARDVVVQSVRPAPAGPRARRALALAYGLTYRDLEQLAALPGVTRVVPVRSFPQELRRRERLHRGRMIATTADYAESEGLALAAGRFFTAAEDEGRANVAVLSAAAADRLFPDGAPLGQSVVVGRNAFVVVGVARDRGAAEEGPDAKIGGDVYLPLRTCQARFGQTLVVRRRGAVERDQVELTQVTLTLARAEQVPPTVEAARGILQASHAPQKDWVVLPGVAE
jgi:RND family efflux transporter MFP subunit